MLFMPLCLLAIENEDDRQFIQELYIQFNRLMYREALRVLKNPVDAGDAVSTACIALIEHLPKLRAINPQVYPAYIMSTVRNQALMLQRQQNSHNNTLRQLMERDAMEKRAAGQMEAEILRRCTLDQMKQALKSLPEMDQLVLRMRYFEHASDAEMSQFLGVRPTTVRSKLMRARNRLYAAMEVQDDEE